jgi:hypothetical protein
MIFDYLIFRGFFAQADSVCYRDIHCGFHFVSECLRIVNDANLRRIMLAKSRWSQRVTVSFLLSTTRLDLVASPHTLPILSLCVSINLRYSHIVSTAGITLGHSQMSCSLNLVDSALSSVKYRESLYNCTILVADAHPMLRSYA